MSGCTLQSRAPPCYMLTCACFSGKTTFECVVEQTTLGSSWFLLHQRVLSIWCRKDLLQKSIFPGFPSYCNFTLGNSNLQLTRSNFRFPSGHFLYNFTQAPMFFTKCCFLKSLTHPLCIARPVVVYEPGGPQKLL